MLALIVVIARLSTPDVLRGPWELPPTSDAVPGGPLQAAGLVFDLLAMVPALLALIFLALNRDYLLSLRCSHLLLLGVAFFVVLSTPWSADRFGAAVTSAHFFAASCPLWAMSQLVRSPGRFRVVSALALGLLYKQICIAIAIDSS